MDEKTLTANEKAELKYIMDGSGAAPFTGMIFNSVQETLVDRDQPGDFIIRDAIRLALQVKIIARGMANE